MKIPFAQIKIGERFWFSDNLQKRCKNRICRRNSNKTGVIMYNTDEIKDQRIQIVVTKTQKNTWQSEAKRRHWTLTTLIELAVQQYLEMTGKSG